MPALKNLAGQKFGRLTVIERAENKNGLVTWKCKCDCGKECVVRSNDLLSNSTKSCGCLREEASHKPKNFKHGMSHTKVYCKWCNILSRCTKPYDKDFWLYGGRGIKI